MKILASICLTLIVLFITFLNPAYAKDINIDDLLIPEISPVIKGLEEGSQDIAQSPNEEMDLDALLGPKDIFPFLPDNHRDSGTGKFNSV